MSQSQDLTVTPESPMWVHRVAHSVESAAQANGLRLAFRLIETNQGPVVSILLMPPLITVEL